MTRTTLACAAALIAPVCAAIPVHAAAATTTANAATTVTTASFTYIRSTCVTTTDGTICVSLLGNGQPSTYEVRYSVAPKTGSWLQPVATARWDGKPYTDDPTLNMGVSWGMGTKYQPFCSSGCGRVTAQTAWTRTTPYLNVYSFVVDGPHGRREVAAGLTPRLSMGAKDSCSQASAAVSYQLTSTNSNVVYYQRRMSLGGALASGGTATLTDDGQRIFSGHYSYGNQGTWSSPTFTASWRRHSVGSGIWSTPLSVGTDGYVSSNAGQPSSDC